MTGQDRATQVGDERLTVAMCEARRISTAFVVVAAAGMIAAPATAQQRPAIRSPVDSAAVDTRAINGQVPRRPNVVDSTHSTAELSPARSGSSSSVVMWLWLWARTALCCDRVRQPEQQSLLALSMVGRASKLEE